MVAKKVKLVKIILGLVSVVLICGSVGGGLYFGGVFSSSDPLKKSAGNSSGESTDGSSNGSTDGSSSGSSGGSTDGSSGGSSGGSTDGSSSGSTDGSSGNNNGGISEETREEIEKLSQQPEYLTEYSSMASSNGNEYEYSCEFTNSNGQILDATIDFSIKKTGDIECIYINKNRDTNEQLNLFPMITFHEERAVLGKLNGNDFTALNNEESDETKEQKIRANAKQIADKIMNQLSYGSEFALLDEIFFSAQIGDSEKEKVAGLYDSLPVMVFWGRGEPIKNDRKIKIKMEEPTTFEDDGTIDAVEYLDNIFYAFAHEYGHHLTLYNDRFKEADSFLNELKEVFSDNSTDFSDFEKIYKYFNNLNEKWKNYNDLGYYDTHEINNEEDEKNKQTIIDTRNEIFKIYRKKYSGNVTSLLNEFPEIIEGESNNEEIIMANLEGLQKSKGIGNPIFSELASKIKQVLKTDENEEKVIIKDKYAELRQYLLTEWTDSPIYVYYIDFNQVFEKPEKFKLIPKSYFFLPSSFSEVVNSEAFNPNGQNGATIGDIFGNDIDVENTPLEPRDDTPGFTRVGLLDTKDNACSNLPLNFASVGHYNYEAINFYFNIKDSQDQNMTYNDFSKMNDDQILGALKYYYSENELLARLYTILTYRYEKNVPLNACAFSSGIFEKIDGKTKVSYYSHLENGVGSERQFYADYSLFKAWGMDILAGENAKTMLKALVKINNIPNTDNHNDFTIISNKRRARRQNADQKTNNFFLSYNVFDEEHSDYEMLSNGMYLLGYTNQDIAKNNILLEYVYKGQSFYKKPLNYDYNNFQYYDPTEPQKLINLPDNGFTKSKLFPQQDNLMLLVFPLYSLTATFSPEGLFQPNAVIPDHPKAQAKLGSPRRVFIDTNENMKFDEGDILLAISP